MLGDFALAAHLVSVVIWIGGLFFTLLVLQPAVATRLNLEARLPLWSRILRIFFAWAWGAALVLLLSGYGLLHVRGGMAAAPLYIHLMGGAGWLMVALFAWIWLFPFRVLSRAANSANWPEGARQLIRVRLALSAKLMLGLVTLLLVGLRLN